MAVAVGRAWVGAGASVGQAQRCGVPIADRVCCPQATVNIAPTPAEGEEMFAVAHIYASFNDTFVVRAAWRRLHSGRGCGVAVPLSRSWPGVARGDCTSTVAVAGVRLLSAAAPAHHRLPSPCCWLCST